MTISEEHMEVARGIAADLPARVKEMNREFAAIVIAEALIEAEREGMERADTVLAKAQILLAHLINDAAVDEHFLAQVEGVWGEICEVRPGSAPDA